MHTQPQNRTPRLLCNRQTESMQVLFNWLSQRLRLGQDKLMKSSPISFFFFFLVRLKLPLHLAFCILGFVFFFFFGCFSLPLYTAYLRTIQSGFRTQLGPVSVAFQNLQKNLSWIPFTTSWLLFTVLKRQKLIIVVM